jgi:hypothetical protein
MHARMCYIYSHSLAVLRLNYTSRIGIVLTSIQLKAQFERSARRKLEPLKASNCEVECLVSSRVIESMSHLSTSSNLLHLCNHNHGFSH